MLTCGSLSDKAHLDLGVGWFRALVRAITRCHGHGLLEESLPQIKVVRHGRSKAPASCYQRRLQRGRFEPSTAG